MLVFNKRTTLILGFFVCICFFFWNLGLYTDQLCEDQIHKIDREKNDALTRMLSELRKIEQEKEDVQFKFRKLEEKVRKNSGQSTSFYSQQQQQNEVIPVIIFAYNRPQYLERSLNNLFENMPQPNEGYSFPIFVSQDGDDVQVTNVIKKFPKVFHLSHTDRTKPIKKTPNEQDSYYYISQHYQFGLHTLFDLLKYKAVILLEDDLEISVDFFSYFSGLFPILNSDPTLFCVSAWNDNGLPQFVNDPHALYRSNFFPGLGWMMTRSLWDELGSYWPSAYWDDWLRENDQRKGRDCIRPEISRTHTFGEKGSSGGQFYDKFLKNMVLNKLNIDWREKDLTYLVKDNYDKYFNNLVETAIQIKQKI